ALMLRQDLRNGSVDAIERVLAPNLGDDRHPFPQQGRSGLAADEEPLPFTTDGRHPEAADVAFLRRRNCQELAWPVTERIRDIRVLHRVPSYDGDLLAAQGRATTD